MQFSEREKPPKIRKKKFPGTKFLGTFGPPPTEKTEKTGKIKGTLVRKVPGNLRSQEFVFFSWAVFLPPKFMRGAVRAVPVFGSGSSSRSDSVGVRFRVRFRAVKVRIFGGFPVENPTKKANRLKALLRGLTLSEYGSEGVEYG